MFAAIRLDTTKTVANIAKNAAPKIDNLIHLADHSDGGLRSSLQIVRPFRFIPSHLRHQAQTVQELNRQNADGINFEQIGQNQPLSLIFYFAYITPFRNGIKKILPEVDDNIINPHDKIGTFYVCSHHAH